jgi:hypothetical protein
MFTGHTLEQHIGADHATKRREGDGCFTTLVELLARKVANEKELHTPIRACSNSHFLLLAISKGT